MQKALIFYNQMTCDSIIFILKNGSSFSKPEEAFGYLARNNPHSMVKLVDDVRAYCPMRHKGSTVHMNQLNQQFWDEDTLTFQFIENEDKSTFFPEVEYRVSIVDIAGEV
tara:strand:- start:530 stop:859 length:330 start_codon:yes stop_codon:yes gene_type:complete